MTEHDTTLSAEDKARYRKQSECVAKVVGIFENPDYNDGDSDMAAQVVNLMNEVSLATPERIICNIFEHILRCNRMDHLRRKLWARYLLTLVQMDRQIFLTAVRYLDYAYLPLEETQ